MLRVVVACLPARPAVTARAKAHTPHPHQIHQSKKTGLTSKLALCGDKVTKTGQATPSAPAARPGSTAGQRMGVGAASRKGSPGCEAGSPVEPPPGSFPLILSTAHCGKVGALAGCPAWVQGAGPASARSQLLHRSRGCSDGSITHQARVGSMFSPQKQPASSWMGPAFLGGSQPPAQRGAHAHAPNASSLLMLKCPQQTRTGLPAPGLRQLLDTCKLTDGRPPVT